MNFDSKQIKIINQISLETGVSQLEAEKAIDGYYKAIASIVRDKSPAIIDMKHLGKMFYSQKLLDKENLRKEQNA